MKPLHLIKSLFDLGAPFFANSFQDDFVPEVNNESTIQNGSNDIAGNPIDLNKYPPNCVILDNWIFENFMLADEPLQRLYKSLKLVY